MGFFYYYFFKKTKHIDPKHLNGSVYPIFLTVPAYKHTNAEHVYTATVGTNVFFQVSNSFLHTQVQSLASTC